MVCSLRIFQGGLRSKCRLKQSNTLLPARTTIHADVFLTTSNCTIHMNRRFIVVMCVLGIAVAGAFFMGSPMFGGFDGIR